MVAFIDDYRAPYGVEPICAVLPIAPATYYAQIDLDRPTCQRRARACCSVDIISSAPKIQPQSRAVQR
jgi:hypothetical protein